MSETTTNQFLERPSYAPEEYRDAVLYAVAATDWEAVEGLLRLFVADHPEEGVQMYDDLRFSAKAAGLMLGGEAR